MGRSVTVLRIIFALVWPGLACSSLPGFAAATPTLWAVQPWMSVPDQPGVAGTSGVLLPDATLPASIPTVATPLEVGILKCQNNPSAGSVPAQTPIVVVWGWSSDNQTKRDEFISISSFTVKVDGQAQDVSSASRVLESATTVRWKLAIGQLSSGTHEIRLATSLARPFTESGGAFAAGAQIDQVCQLVVQP